MNNDIDTLAGELFKVAMWAFVVLAGIGAVALIASPFVVMGVVG